MAKTDRASRWPRRFLGVLSLACAGCAASAEAPPSDEHTRAVTQPIIGGTTSGASQNAVVLVMHVAPDADQVEVCSGTMLTPRLVLTARHCVAYVDPLVTCASDGTALSGGSIGPSYAAEDMFVYGGRQRASLGAALEVAVPGTTIIDDGASTLCNHDLALILLERPVPETTIAPVRLEGATSAGELTTIVGWGRDDTGSLTRTRLQRTAEPVLAVGPDVDLGLGAAELLLGEGACEGDSGGPAFAASGAAIGLLSRGGSASGESPTGVCADDDIGVYTATAGFASLLLSAYAQAGQEPWLEGQPNPTLAKLGEACSRDADCGSNACAPDRNVCTEQCSLSGCPDGFACSDQNECVRSPSHGDGGGCAVGSRSRGAELLVVVLVFVVVRRARGARGGGINSRAASRASACGSSPGSAS